VSKSLVVARVGRNSLHGCWVDRGVSRAWDLRLAPYQPIPEQDPAVCVVGDVIPGPKWTGLRELFNTWDGWRDYDYIWLPDDDIAASQSAINQLFDVAAEAGLDLFAPALDEHSYFAHFDTVRNPSFFGRRVGFVEIMIPGFSRPALERLLPTLDESETGWGWGLDSVWPKLLDYRNVGIVDAVAVTHTRPVGVMRDPDLRRRVHEESDRLLARYGCRQEHVTLGAFGPDGEVVETTSERLLAQLVEGYWPLIERDPRVLSWIADAQCAHFGGVEYPTAGTPSGPVITPTTPAVRALSGAVDNGAAAVGRD
jgi:hypothetical protein